MSHSAIYCKLFAQFCCACRHFSHVLVNFLLILFCNFIQGGDSVTSFTSGSPLVMEDTSDNELEYSQQCYSLPTDPDDVIEAMLSDHDAYSAENGAGLEAPDLTCNCKSVQENPCPGGSHIPQMEMVCMQFKPMSQQLRRAMVTGQDVNREWLTISNTVSTTYKGSVCQGEDSDKESDEENSEKRKRKAMDRLVSEGQL